MLIRTAKSEDSRQLVLIEQQSFSHPHWKAEDFLKYETTVAEAEGQIAGFLVSRQTFPGSKTTLPEREILNIAVAPAFRCQGIASALLSHHLQAPGEYFLEVRESNLAAQALYRLFGFSEVGRRAAYYQSPVEGAIVMKMEKC